MAETNPYMERLKGSDTYEAVQQKARRDRGMGVMMLFVIAVGSVYGNVYLMRQPASIPYLVEVREDGKTVSSPIPRAADIPIDNPRKQDIIHTFLWGHIFNSQVRVPDRETTSGFLNLALTDTAGPAVGTFRAGVATEKPFERIKKEVAWPTIRGTVYQLLKDNPKLWGVNWTEDVKDLHGVLLRTDEFEARFHVIEDPKAVAPGNIFGLRIVVRQIDAVRSTPAYQQVTTSNK